MKKSDQNNIKHLFKTLSSKLFKGIDLRTIFEEIKHLKKPYFNTEGSHFKNLKNKA